MHPRGTIFHHHNLVFHNGFTGNKYLVLLNTPDKKEPYLFVKTTSQKKHKTIIIGCQKKNSLFFIPKNTTFFKLDTWVQLYEYYLFSPSDFAGNQDIKKVGSLSAGATDEIVKCMLKTQADDLPRQVKNLLQPPLKDSLEKLQSKFNRGR